MEERKKDHIELALKSRLSADSHDQRFYYEPMLSAHPEPQSWNIDFLDKKMDYPMWVSSMTGGTGMAGTINRNLAMACREFGLGMGLGSCRIILDSDTHFNDFNLRPILGQAVPFYANLGIAQVELLLEQGQYEKMSQLVRRLDADGLIVHINPLQEWLQPEGDRIRNTPLATLKQLLDRADFPVIVKEVGQGMGPASLRALLELPLAAIEFAAYGGTNFSKLELMRASQQDAQLYEAFAYLGHTAEEMLGFINNHLENPLVQPKVSHLIISGGIRNAIDGYHLISKSKINAVFGQASAFLQHAMVEYDNLQQYVRSQIESLTMARAFLQPRT